VQHTSPTPACRHSDDWINPRLKVVPVHSPAAGLIEPADSRLQPDQNSRETFQAVASDDTLQEVTTIHIKYT